MATDLTPQYPIPSYENEVVLPTLFQDTPNQLVGGFNASPSDLSKGNVKFQSDGERILLGQATAPLTGIGVFIGSDQAATVGYDFRAGDPSGNYIHWDASLAILTIVGTITATAGSIGGWSISAAAIYFDGATDALSAGFAPADYPLYIGKKYADRATAPIRATPAGQLTVSNIVITGIQAGSSLDGQYVLANSIGSAAANLALQSWSQTCVFSVTDLDTIAWASGTLKLADGTTYNISAGNTGNMSARTYIYLDIAVSITVYQTTTTPATAVGNGKKLVATALNGTTEASYFVYDGTNSMNVDGANIAQLTVGTTELAALAVTTAKIAALAVTSAELAALSVTTAKIAALAVTSAKLAAGAVTSVKGNLALRGWTQTSVFSVASATQVNWGIGTLTASDGTAYSIAAGNTGAMSVKTYIYLDIAVSTTAYQITTTAATAVGDGKVLVAIAQNNTTEAIFTLLNNNSQNIDASNIVTGSLTANEIAASTITGAKIAATTITASNIVALTITAAEIAAGTITGVKIAATTITAANIAASTITANEIAANTITAAKMSVTDLSAISANIGAITAGTITVVGGGNTVAITPGATNAIIAGPTGAPTFILTTAGHVKVSSLERKDYHLFTIFESLDGYGKSLAGTGIATIGSVGISSITGTVSGNLNEIYKLSYTPDQYAFTWDKDKTCKYSIGFQNPVTECTAKIGIGSLQTATARHMGFYIVNGAVTATVADGTTETTLDLGSTISSNYFYLLELRSVAGVGVGFYINNVLRGTITTNLPTGKDFTEWILDWHLTITSNAQREMWLSFLDIWQAN